MFRTTLLPLLAALVTSALPLAGGCAATPAAPAAAAAAERRVHTPAGELAVREAGRGATPLLLWHSLYTDPSMFDPLVEQLAPNYRLLLVSAPGHGNSGPPLAPLTSAASGAAVLAVLDAYGVERAAVVGCSWGGIAGLQAALQAPQRITAVAAFNTPFGPGATDLGTRSIVGITGWLGNTEFFGRRVASNFFSQHTRTRQPEVVERFAAAFKARDPRTLQAVSRAVLMERESLLPLLPKLRVPVLAVSGAEDPLYPAAQAEEIARSIPKARFVSVPDSAHLTPLEQPVITAKLVRELVPPQQ
ncbi:MAG: alpha/beta fold hydrolase [Betaproteobacteria bacterium]|jgi:3-oxoadipate enol-lactonase